MDTKRLLVSFYNAVHSTCLTIDSPDSEVKKAIKWAMTMLVNKNRTMRRQRLSLLFDQYAWSGIQGGLNHLMITIPFWLRSVAPPRTSSLMPQSLRIECNALFL